MKYRMLFALVSFILLSFSNLQAQIDIPVTWEYKLIQQKNNTAILELEATIKDKWHLYSQHTPENGPLSLFFEFEESNSWERIGDVKEPNPLVEYDEIFKVDVLYFKEKVVFTQEIKILTDQPFLIRGTSDYQACIDGKCVPGNDDFEIPVNGAKPVPVGKNAELDQAPPKTVSFGQLQTSGDVVPVDDARTIDQSEILPNEIVATEVSKPISSEPTGENRGLWIFFFISFLAGLAAILTPCVFPMIPMTVTFFMKDKDDSGRGKREALVYGFSIIAIYTFIGSILAVIAGPAIANWLSTHWLPNILFFLIFMVFAASFLGMFEIVLPSSLVNKSDAKADRGGYVGAIFMAITLVLVSFSCTGPIVGAILVESAGGAVLRPIIGMFGFSLAFALPFTLFAFFPGWLKNLPKSGGWLNSVKVVLGFIEIALGLKFLSVADQTYHWGILDRDIYLAFWIVIFTLMGFYLLGKLKFSHDSDMPFLKVPRFALAIVTFTFVVYLIPGMFGAPLKALSGYLPPAATHDFDLDDKMIENTFLLQDFISEEGNAGALGSKVSKNDCPPPKYADQLHLPHGLKGYFDYDQALACSKAQNKPLFIDFTGHGCVNCREMEANVWSSPEVLKRLRNDFVIVALYVDDKKIKLPEDEWVVSTYDGKTKKTLGKKYADFQITRFNVNAQPYYVLLDAEENLLVQPRGYDLNVNDFVKFLDDGLAAFHKK